MAFCRCCEPNQTPTYIPPIPRTFKQSFQLSHSPLQMADFTESKDMNLLDLWGYCKFRHFSCKFTAEKNSTPWMGYSSLFARWKSPRLAPQIVPNRLSKVGSFRVRELFHNFTDVTPCILAACFFFLGASSGDGKKMLISCGKWWCSHDIYHDIYAMDQCNLYLLVLHKKNSTESRHLDCRSFVPLGGRNSGADL